MHLPYKKSNKEKIKQIKSDAQVLENFVVRGTLITRTDLFKISKMLKGVLEIKNAEKCNTKFLFAA